MSPLTRGPKSSETQRASRMGVSRGWGRWGGESMFHGDTVSVWEDEGVEMDGVMAGQREWT